MANSTIKFMLGLYPKTDQIEKRREKLLNEFGEFNQYSKSGELARYEELEHFVNSPEFAERKNYYLSLVYKNSEEEKKEKEYVSLKKQREIKFYYKFKSSSDLSLFSSLDGSKEIDDFEQLKAFVESPEFRKVEEYMKDKKKFERTDEFRKQQEMLALANNENFRAYFLFVRNKAFTDFQKYYNSSEISDFEILEKYVQSQEFLRHKADKEFKHSEAFRKYQDYVQKKKRYTNYYKLVNDKGLTSFKKLHGSDELNYFNELEKFVQSQQFKDKKKEMEALKFENTEEFKKLQAYKKIASQKKIREYYRIKSSGSLTEFRTLEKSKTISDFEALEKYIQSGEFKNRKIYLLDSKKWEKSEEYKKYQEYSKLKSSPKITWYLKLKTSGKFDELKDWNLVFEDDFTTGSLDRNKWLTRYFWGEVLMHDTFALPGDKHLFTDGKNLVMNGSTVKIVTKNEKAKGKEWNPMFGFFPKDFDYTSGILSSGSSFRTRYGKFEAKIKLDSSKDILHAFWLSGDTKVPQIDVFQCYNSRLSLSTFWGNASEASGIRNDTVAMKASKFVNSYFIYSLEWSPEKIVWRINDLEVKTQTSNIPDEPLYVVFNSGVVGDHPIISSGMEIDWVRCYQKY